MITVVTHRGQETLQVLIMGYIKSMAYILHKIDNILWDVYTSARAYVDDIICRAESLPDLLKKLCILFDIYFEYNISIKPSKSFLNYSNIGLLC